MSLSVTELLVIATVTGLVDIRPAAAMHEGGTLFVIVNALRFLRCQDLAAPTA